MPPHHQDVNGESGEEIMTFSDNLVSLRANRHMTQEQLAMLVGVSRQAISKWESGKAYPEMDKLLIICDLFTVSLDDLVLGDVTQPAPPAVRPTSQDTVLMHDGHDGYNGPVSMAASLPSQPVMPNVAQDMTGYDSHMRQFAAKISLGVGAIILGVGLAQFFDPANSVLGSSPANDALLFIVLAIGVLIGLALLIPAGLSHDQFMKRHPYIEDFYTEQDHNHAANLLAIGVISGIAAIFMGVVVMVFADEALHVDDGWPAAIMLILIGIGVTSIVYAGIMYARINVDAYNNHAEEDEQGQHGHNTDQDSLTGAVCGIIMLIATCFGLLWLFGIISPNDSSMFWICWPIGGILCGIASLVINIVKRQ
ncbi:DNA-binding helix-turn-helix protein [Bifidobacterium gallicum DSM 20093 = LMG 11596]|nr:DNA-binding helix-turn-helix protein [Bifidobacterium gallicum DSM 20093 = LMG 11596]